MILRPPRSTLDRSSAASDVYKRQDHVWCDNFAKIFTRAAVSLGIPTRIISMTGKVQTLSLIHISEPTRPY